MIRDIAERLILDLKRNDLSRFYDDIYRFIFSGHPKQIVKSLLGLNGKSAPKDRACLVLEDAKQVNNFSRRPSSGVISVFVLIGVSDRA